MAVQFVLSRDVLGLPPRFDARPNDFCMQNEEEILRLLSGLFKKADTSMITLLDFDCSGSRDSMKDLLVCFWNRAGQRHETLVVMFRREEARKW
jgi:hypothetical protein